MRIKEKHFRDDDGDSAKDRLFEDVTDSLEGYLKLFERLQDRAKRHGICTVLIISAHDPLTDYASHRTQAKGNWIQNSGAFHEARKAWEEA